MNWIDSVSADGFISGAISIFAIWVLVLQVIHDLKHLKDKYADRPIVGKIIERAERQRERTLSLTKRVYELRFVTLFILLAMVVSTISPVSSLLEVEEGVIRKSCENLEATGSLSTGIDLRQCVPLASAGEESYFNRSIEATKSHFVQVALWPLLATLYGFGLAVFVRVVRKDENQPIEEVIELFPHVHHILAIIVAGTFAVLSFIQNGLGS